MAVLTKIEPSSWMYKYGVRWTQSLESFGRQANVSYMVTMLKEIVMITKGRVPKRKLLFFWILGKMTHYPKFLLNKGRILALWVMYTT